MRRIGKAGICPNGPRNPLVAKLGHGVLADSEQALGPKRKRWRAGSPLLQGNELDSPAGSGRHCCNAASAVMVRDGCFGVDADASGHLIRQLVERQSSDAARDAAKLRPWPHRAKSGHVLAADPVIASRLEQQYGLAGEAAAFVLAAVGDLS